MPNVLPTNYVNTYIIKNIRERGCLKALDKHVFCVTRLDTWKPCAIHIEGGHTCNAYDLAFFAEWRVHQWAPEEIQIHYTSVILIIISLWFTLDELGYTHLFHCMGNKGLKKSNLIILMVSVAPDGSLYSENHCVQVFDGELNFLRAFGGIETDPGKLKK